MRLVAGRDFSFPSTGVQHDIFESQADTRSILLVATIPLPITSREVKWIGEYTFICMMVDTSTRNSGQTLLFELGAGLWLHFTS
jgi:hypothetical protein